MASEGPHAPLRRHVPHADRMIVAASDDDGAVATDRDGGEPRAVLTELVQALARPEWLVEIDATAVIPDEDY